MGPEASVAGVALGTTTPAQWKQMGAAIVAGVEAGWVNPVINKVREWESPHHGCNILIKYLSSPQHLKTRLFFPREIEKNDREIEKYHIQKSKKIINCHQVEAHSQQGSDCPKDISPIPRTG